MDPHSPHRAPGATTSAPGILSGWPKRLARWLVTGLIVLAPAFVTWLALAWLFKKLDSPLRDALAGLTGYDIPGAGVVSVVIILLITGALASNFAMRSALRAFERLLDRIPFVRTLYSGIKQLLAPLADEHTGAFQKVVVISYPDANSYALGFLINPHAGVSPSGEPLAAVLVPTNHLHLGNVVLCPSSRIHDVDLSAEQALRFLVSMGAALDRPVEMRAAKAAPPAAAVVDSGRAPETR